MSSDEYSLRNAIMSSLTRLLNAIRKQASISVSVNSLSDVQNEHEEVGILMNRERLLIRTVVVWNDPVIFF